MDIEAPDPRGLPDWQFRYKDEAMLRTITHPDVVGVNCYVESDVGSPVPGPEIPLFTLLPIEDVLLIVSDILKCIDVCRN